MLVFDDHASAFYPLALNRSVGDLRCGILKLRQRLQQLFAAERTAVWIEPRLLTLYAERHPDWLINKKPDQPELWINSRLQVSPAAVSLIQGLEPEQGLRNGEILIAFRSSRCVELPSGPSELQSVGCSLQPCELPVYGNLSDLIHDNDRLLRFDFDHFFSDQDNYFETEPGVTTLNPYQIWIAEGVELKPGVVLDASEGPIVLDEGAKVMPNAVITGPAYIGKHSVVKVGAKIYGGTSIGPVCKVGGEVEGSILQAFSNKQHDGFLGHSFVGEWVNIGADTNNSDLKNTYKNVSFYSYASRGKIDSGSIFLGALLADHVKLGINASLNTGCVVGIGSNLWGADLITGFVPDFSWGQGSQLTTYRFDAFCQTAAAVKQRRQLAFSDAEKDLYRKILENWGR